MKPSVAVLGGLLFGAIGVFCAVVMVEQFTRGKVLNAVVALGGAAFCFGFVIPLFKVVPGRVTARVQSDSEGTTFRPDLDIDIPMQASMGGAVVACVLILILVPIGKLTIPVPPHMRYSLPFMAAVLTVMGAPMLCRNLLRGSTSYLRLTTRGFELAQGWKSQRGEWVSVKDVAAEPPDKQKQTPGTIAVVMSDDAVFTLTALSFTPDGAALRELVRFYWQLPEARDELTDGRGAKRLAGR